MTAESARPSPTAAAAPVLPLQLLQIPQSSSGELGLCRRFLGSSAGVGLAKVLTFSSESGSSVQILPAAPGSMTGQASLPDWSLQASLSGPSSTLPPTLPSRQHGGTGHWLPGHC